jgi:hypothetical protein
MANYLLQEDTSYLLQETGDKLLLNEGLSESLSSSVSESASVSYSPSTSISLSPSISVSLSASASPSIGYNIYSRGDYSILPTTNLDLETIYTDSEETIVSTRNFQYVGQTAVLEYMIHQVKEFASGQSYCNVEWEGKSSLAPRSSPVYLQVYNCVTDEWETIDTESSAREDINFELSAKVRSLTNYVENHEITVRVYQLATE